MHTSKMSLLAGLFLTCTASAQSPFKNTADTVYASSETVEQGSKYASNLSGNLTTGTTGTQTSMSGEPGSNTDIVIRGFNDIYGNNAPLIMLNGLPFYGTLSSINMADVNSIVIEKSPLGSSAPLSQSLNGIVHITTRKAQYKKWRFDLNTNWAMVARGAADYNVISEAKDYYELAWQAYKNQLVANGINPAMAAQMASGKTGQNGIVDVLGGYNSYNVAKDQLIDPITGKLNPTASLRYNDSWKKELERTGLRHQHYVSAAKSWDKVSLYMGLGYLSEDGYIRKSGFNRLSAYLNADYSPITNLTVGVSGNFARSKEQFIPLTNDEYNPFFAMRNMAPIYPVYYYNAANTTEQDPLTGDRKYDWGDKIKYPNSSMGMGFRPFFTGSNTVGLLNLDQRSNTYNTLQVAPFVKYTFLKDFTFTTTAQVLQRKIDNYFANNANYGLGYIYGNRMITTHNSSNNVFIIKPEIAYRKNIGLHEIMLAASYMNMGTNRELEQLIFVEKTNDKLSEQKVAEKNNFQNFGLDVNYNFAKKYFVSARASYDAFAKTKSSTINWVAGLAWDATQGSNAPISLLLKTDYGVFNNYVQKSYNPDPLFVKTFEQPIFKQFSAGFNLGLFGKSVVIEANYFNRLTENIPFFTPMPSPFPELYHRCLSIKNAGIEVALLTTPVKSQNISWTINTYLTHYKNKVVSLPENLIYPENHFTLNESIYRYYLVQYAGVDKSNGNALYYQNVNGVQSTTSNYNNASGSRAFSGSPIPDVFGSILNNLSYKQFNFQFSFAYSLGGKVYDAPYQSLMSTRHTGQNWHKDMQQSWTPENPNSNQPRMVLNDPFSTAPSTRFLVDASWLRLSNVLLSYSIPAKSLTRFGFSDVRIYASADNLFFISKRKGLDPQSSFSGMMGYGYAPARTIMLGVNVGL